MEIMASSLALSMMLMRFPARTTFPLLLTFMVTEKKPISRKRLNTIRMPSATRGISICPRPPEAFFFLLISLFTSRDGFHDMRLGQLFTRELAHDLSVSHDDQP